MSNQITVRVRYSDGDEVVTGISATLAEARHYFHGFERVVEDLETGRETRSQCVSVFLA